jgi:type III secretion protein C
MKRNAGCQSPSFRSLRLAAASLCMAAAANASWAAPLTWDSTAPMAPIVARDMPLQEFMQALVGAHSISVVVSPAAMQRTVNGRFSGSQARAFDMVVRSSSLLPYFDGSTLYLFTSAEAARKTLTVSPVSAARTIATLNQLRLHDGRYNTFAAVPASGLLQVTGAKPFVDQVQEVVRSVQLSGPASPEQIAVYPLQHAWAWDVTVVSAGKPVVVPGIATLLRNLLGAAGAVQSVKTVRTSVPKLRGQGFAVGIESDAMSAAEANNAAAGADGGLTEVGPRGASGPTVSAEIRSNSVVVRDTPDRLPQYAELVKALDVEPVMVEVEATIVDINSDKLQELGINWRVRDSNSEVRLGRGNSTDLALRGPGIDDITPTGRGLTWSTIIDRAGLIARISALAATGNARVISRAQVATMANLESAIQSSQTAYVRVGGFQEVDLFPVTATTNLRVTPRVVSRADRKLVSMVVSIRDGKFTDAVTDGIPSVREVSVSTNGLVPEDQSFVVGGFRQESDSLRADKIPFFGDLPGIGALFRTTTDQIANSERLFLLTPKVVDIARLLERAAPVVPSLSPPAPVAPSPVPPPVPPPTSSAPSPSAIASRANANAAATACAWASRNSESVPGQSCPPPPPLSAPPPATNARSSVGLVANACEPSGRISERIPGQGECR